MLGQGWLKYNAHEDLNSAEVHVSKFSVIDIAEYMSIYMYKVLCLDCSHQYFSMTEWGADLRTLQCPECDQCKSFTVHDHRTDIGEPFKASWEKWYE